MGFHTCKEGKKLGASPLNSERQSDCGQLFDAVKPQLDTKAQTRIKTHIHGCEEIYSTLVTTP